MFMEGHNVRAEINRIENKEMVEKMKNKITRLIGKFWGKLIKGKKNTSNEQY